LVRALIKMVVRGRYARLIIQNEDDFKALRDARVAARENIRLIRGSGVDMSLFQPRALPRAGHATRVLFAARLLWDKGIGEYVAAARLLKKANVAVELLLAGMPDRGNPTSVAPEQIERWVDEGLIIYLGHVTDMPALLSQVDMAVLPSYREGAPRSLIEAAAAGLPIITTDVPGCREVVQHKVNGLLVPVREVKPLVQAIRFLHEHPPERIRMGQAGREKALHRFDQRIVFDATHAVYLELLAHLLPKSNQNALQAR
jgi:glycosyltransferase involved in cell wall biosynthesis